jgi:hypothetical protein
LLRWAVPRATPTAKPARRKIIHTSSSFEGADTTARPALCCYPTGGELRGPDGRSRQALADVRAFSVADGRRLRPELPRER